MSEIAHFYGGPLDGQMREAGGHGNVLISYFPPQESARVGRGEMPTPAEFGLKVGRYRRSEPKDGKIVYVWIG